jgi:hypothetical protein
MNSDGKQSLKIGNLEDGVVIARPTSKDGHPVLEIQKIDKKIKIKTKIRYSDSKE